MTQQPEMDFRIGSLGPSHGFDGWYYKIVRSSVLAWFPVLFLLFFGSCRENNPVAPVTSTQPPPSVTGAWSGAFANGAPLTLSLNEISKTITGVGNYAGLTVSIVGYHHDPVVSFTMSSGNYAPAYFSGRMLNDSVVTGAFDSSGFSHDAITFVRKGTPASTPLSITVNQISLWKLNVSWSDTTTGRTKFLVARSTNGTSYYLIASLPGTSSQTIDSVQAPGTYYYAVFTITKDDTSWPRLSSPAIVPDPTPTGVLLSRTAAAYLQLTWNDVVSVNHSMYVERKVDAQEFLPYRSIPMGTKSLVDTVRGYHTYQYRVSVASGSDSSAKVVSNTYAVQDPNPSQLHVDFYNLNALTVSWASAIPFASGYAIARSVNGGPFTPWKNVGPGVTSTQDTAAATGTLQYQMYATADGTKSDSVLSNVLTVTRWLPGLPYTAQSNFARGVRLDNGDVLIFDQSSTQRFNSQTGQWSTKGAMAANTQVGFPIKLQDGSILDIGGVSGGSYVNEVFDPVSESWHTVGALQDPLGSYTSLTSALLNDGTVYFAGSYYASNGNSYVRVQVAGKYLPGSSSFVRDTLPPRAYTPGALFLLSNGKALAVGGTVYSDSTGQLSYVGNCYLFDPSLHTWAATAALPRAVPGILAVDMANGTKVVVLRDTAGSSSYEVYDVATGVWQQSGSLPEWYVYATTKTDEDTLYAVLGPFVGAPTSFYRYVLSSNTWTRISDFPASAMSFPTSLFPLARGEFMALSPGGSRPLFYLPWLQ